ncbi:hypothetical protein SAY86_025876 [Trapa natans]|uniref:Uncharacterized protein n=1 Tax=Trapa natans TaxID=22666 RepID=A0AAN7KD84_TRANT|nr:hypothetical protein SAY86_025876 [Trapa natans]
MNPLTLVKRIQKINTTEASLGISEKGSWHAKYKDSAYIFVGGIPFDLTEGDLLTVFAQYGEVVDVNLVRDKGTGKSKGFAFLAYEDQRSTNLAVDNLNGGTVAGRIIRVDHVSNYKKKEEEDEEAARKKREERGVCRAFQRGECTRGDGCKFSHDEQRAANTGWGADDQKVRWGHDKYDGPVRSDKKPDKFNRCRIPEIATDARGSYDTDIGSTLKGREMQSDEKRLGRNADEKLETESRVDQKKGKILRSDNYDHFKSTSKDYERIEDGTSKRFDDERLGCKPREGDYRKESKRSRRGSDDFDVRTWYRTEEKLLHRHESESYQRKYENRRCESKSSRDTDHSFRHRRGEDQNEGGRESSR